MSVVCSLQCKIRLVTRSVFTLFLFSRKEPACIHLSPMMDCHSSRLVLLVLRGSIAKFHCSGTWCLMFHAASCILHILQRPVWTMLHVLAIAELVHNFASLVPFPLCSLCYTSHPLVLLSFFFSFFTLSLPLASHLCSVCAVVNDTWILDETFAYVFTRPKWHSSFSRFAIWPDNKNATSGTKGPKGHKFYAKSRHLRDSFTSGLISVSLNPSYVCVL